MQSKKTSRYNLSLQISMSPPIATMLAHLAKEDGTTLSETIRTLIRNEANARKSLKARAS